MLHIRPHQVFHMVDLEQRKFYMQLPSGMTGLSTLETCILMALFKAVKPQKIFEFGTYLGETTLTWAYNLEDKDAKIFTLDLPSVQGVEFIPSDEKCARVGTSNRKYFENTDQADKIVSILEDSLYFNAEQYSDSMQYIFIDANHMVTYASNDTKNAMTMLDKQVPSCIIWHDYGNPEFPDLTQYLDNLSKEIDLYHVEATMLAFYLNKCGIAPKQVD